MKESILNTLNINQKKAASNIEKDIRIIAGAGSGKTRVLMARIAYLIDEIGIYPSRILAITFTNKASNEMKERLEAILGQDAGIVRISTIHSLCVRILREDANAMDFPKSFTILDGNDQKSILNPFYKEMDIDKKSFPQVRALGYISNQKMNFISPSEAMNYAMTEEQEVFAKLYEKYEKRKNQMKAMDFDDLLLNGHHLLNSNSIVREKWQNRLDYIHVDEFQDVDPIQYGIIRLLTGSHARLCVVGDPDQTIYTWRGASVDIILRFNNDFPNCETIILNENYRSTQPILNASNALIQNNKKRIKKDLFTQRAGEEKIVIHCSEDDSEEPLYIASLAKAKHHQGKPYSSMAVLYRSNYSSRAFERRLREASIPYIIYGGIRFYERQEIKDALSYLKLCTYPDASDPEQFSLDLALLRVINSPRRGFGAKSLEQLQAEGQDRHLNLYEVLRNPESLNTSCRKKGKEFFELMESIRAKREDYSLEDYLDYILDQTGYYHMLEQEHEEERIENLKELRQDIAQSLEENPEMTLEDYLQEISLFTDKAQDQNTDALMLMTVHAAKGLEFDSVFLVNFNDGVFPSNRAIEEGGESSLEEERRLAYVAMTRAKEHLVISYNRGYSYQLGSAKLPSRFIREIPEKYIEQEKKVQVQEKQAVLKKSIPTGHSIKMRKGDLVLHKQYGEGVILKVDGRVATIAFDHRFGIKKLNILHPSLKKLK